MKTPAIMVLGTASHVGKSLLTAALGRIFSDDGVRVAPFKAQNMSLNSAVTPDGREIGRAQALQAEACRVAPSAEMNPVLIKPSTHTSAQIILLGRVWGQVTAADYHQRRVEELFPAVLDSYRKLASRYGLMLIEGAGSPAEINLKAHDIVNMRMAHAAGAACLLVGDIDRGGVFASLLGTVELLDQSERASIRAFIINKFRGDIALLRPGIEAIEKRIGIPCAGVVPYLPEIGLEEEDSVGLEHSRQTAGTWSVNPVHHSDRRLKIGAVELPHMANFTDFDALASEPSVSLAYIRKPEHVRHADLLILPGSKQTLDDLNWLNANGVSDAILQANEQRSPRAGIIGICGGMQMLGHSIDDPAGVENDGIPAAARALGLLPISTTLAVEKTTRCVTGRTSAGLAFHGYEIHLGETTYAGAASPFAQILRSGDDHFIADGAVNKDGSVRGTYVHGLFDDDEFRHAFLSSARAICGLREAEPYARRSGERQHRIDRLAAHVRGALDMPFIRALATAGRSREAVCH